MKRKRDTPRAWPWRIATRRLFLLLAFVADVAANGGATDGADSAATGQHGTANGTDAGTDGGVLLLRRHAGTTGQAEQHGCCHGAKYQLLGRFHFAYLFVKQ